MARTTAYRGAEPTGDEGKVEEADPAHTRAIAIFKSHAWRFLASPAIFEASIDSVRTRG